MAFIRATPKNSLFQFSYHAYLEMFDYDIRFQHRITFRISYNLTNDICSMQNHFEFLTIHY